ncbi:hypothetical protein [Erythrobacter crassostreae]|uniref:Uncharacterized protein n=1 Tax=Erythrobacter crassostreae TaxID=2828328 RepID=A0A9X1F119_9SPHN|nr:hypothetical protein [Erythrobacter crassostrea]MBV7258375.1 hypothetical protein [Erythrobacter crassostrea]
MLKYRLLFVAHEDEGIRELMFNARSTSGALDTAKRAAEGDWAELYQGDELLCNLRLVEETGVWLVMPGQSAQNG